MSSEFRLNTPTVSSSSLWTCLNSRQLEGYSCRVHTLPTNLSAFAIVLVFASEAFVLESVEDLTDCFRWFSQHRFQRHTRRQFAVFPQAIDSEFE